MRERAVESDLHDQVVRAGGTTRKFKGRIHVPDRVVIWPWGRVHFVETKAPGKKARAGQEREHKRLRAFGCEVFVIDTKEAVNRYVERCTK